MGLTIERERFDPADYQRFELRLEECLVALERLLERPGFGTGPVTVGAELELCLVDRQGRALPRNQVHLRVDPDRCADHFNAAQLATGPVLAVAGNFPTFCGHRLWQETRVALFKQAVDDRDAAGQSSRRVSRVAFGTGWIRNGPLELLEESVRLHQGTVWRWNRAIYDPAGGGHLRIEMRALPAGPTVVDMLANAAFLLGLTLALAPGAAATTRRFAFQQAHHNFYRAAQFGLAAELAWPLDARGRPGIWPPPTWSATSSPRPARAWRTPACSPRRQVSSSRSSRPARPAARPAPPGSTWPLPQGR